MFWFSKQKPKFKPIPGLVLPGGGARNAYQVGVLKAIAELLPQTNNSPFPVITGTSSGAINAALLASTAGQYRQGIERLEGVWRNFESNKVFHADPLSAMGSGLRWVLSIATGSMLINNPRSVLNNNPLRQLLESHVRMARIQQAIDNGDLRALGITASGYDSGMSTCYFQGTKDIVPWQRTQRRGVAAELRIEHLLASIAIPLVFPSVKINGEFHGDGTMRESAPLSPALHLGANRLLIIGVEDSGRPVGTEPPLYPSVGQISGYVLDTLFMDSLNADIERMNRINITLSETPDKRVEVKDTTLRPIEFLVISPSIDIGEVVERHVGKTPLAIRTLLRGMGAMNREGRPLISYLLFEGAFCAELIELGYQDGLAEKDAILKLMLPED